MKKTLLIIALFTSIATGFAQVTDAESSLKTKTTDTIEGWKKGGTVGLNFAQSSFSDWVGGGQNSIAVNGLLSVFAHYQKGPHRWENYLDLGYGTNKIGDSKTWFKTDDKIDFTSKYGRKAAEYIYWAALLNFKTQMAPGFSSPEDPTVISNLFAPAYLIGAIGLDYVPNEHFTAFVAPFTSKSTFVTVKSLSDAGAFGVEPGKTFRSEFGGYLRMFYTRNLMKNIGFQTKLDLFSNYLEEPQNIDVSWEVLLSMKVNQYISTTLSTHLLYDHDIIQKTQFKQVLAVGFSYNF